MQESTKSLATTLVSSYVSHNKLYPHEFLKLIDATIAVLAKHDAPPIAEKLSAPEPAPAPAPAPKLKSKPQSKPARAPAPEPTPSGRGRPAVPITESVTPDYIVCLDTGKRYRRLAFALRALKLTPKQYRERWGLPDDYPMAAENYLAQQSEVMKKTWRNGSLSAKSLARPPQPAEPEQVLIPREEYVKPSQTAIADAIRAAAEAEPEAANTLPLSRNAAAYIAAPPKSDPGWRALKRRDGAVAAVKVVVKNKKHHVTNGHAQPVNGAARG